MTGTNLEYLTLFGPKLYSVCGVKHDLDDLGVGVH